MISTYTVLVFVRIALILGSVLFLYEYGQTFFVAFEKYGNEVLKTWDLYYAVLAPILYAVFCVVTGFGWVRGNKMLKYSGVIVHLVVAPSVYYSLNRMGYYLLFLAPLWLAVYWLSRRVSQYPDSTVNLDARIKYTAITILLLFTVVVPVYLLFNDQEKIKITKLTKEQESIYNKLVGKSKKIYKLQQSLNQPINFVGKVVDQDGNGVEGVEITYTVAHYPIVPRPDFSWATQSKKITSDNTGVFVISNESGVHFHLKHFKKPGYQFSQYANIYLKSYKKFPDDKLWKDYSQASPYILKSWKLTKPARLVHATKFIGLRNDGRIYSLDFMSKRFKEEGVRWGDLVVSMTMATRDNNRFDWTVKIEVDNGGIMESEDEIMNMAPNAGYKEKWQFEMLASDSKWKSRLRKRFYIYTNKRYGRVEMEFVPGYRGGSAIDLTYWINPTGSRNLEYWNK